MAMLTRWNPNPEISTVANQMERLFDQMLGHGLRRNSEERSLRGAWMPAINILEKDEAILISADLPGLRAEDVEVTVEEGVLTIRGERKLEELAEGETYHRVERLYGSFERTFTVPNSVAAENISAQFRNGEMTLTLPKREESKPRSIKINIEE